MRVRFPLPVLTHFYDYRLKMKKSTLIIISLLLGVFLLFFAFREVNWKEIETALFLFPKNALIFVALINFLAVFIVGSYRWQVILKSQKCSVSFWKVVRAKMAGFTMSYVTPTALIAGEPIRAYMIKEESQCGWEKSSASVIVDQIIYLICLFCVIILGFVFLWEKFSLPKDVTYGFFAVFALVLVTTVVFYKKTFQRGEGEHAFFSFVIHKTKLSKIKYINNKLGAIEKTEKIIEGFFKESKTDFLLVVVLAFLEVFLDAFAILVTCFYMGHWVGIVMSVGVFSLWALASLAPIPGSLGSAELVLSFAFTLLNAGGSDTGLAFSLIYRVINIFFCLLGIMAFLHFTIKTASHSFGVEAPPLLMRLHKTFTRFFVKDE